MIADKNIYLLMGPPGSGKGSLSKLCIKSLNWLQLSTGNLCREHIANQTEIGRQIDFAIKSGKLVSDSLVIDMVDCWLDDILNKASGIILDGFPRTTTQAIAFDSLLNTKFKRLHLHIIRLAVPDEFIVARLAARYICNNKGCQAVYSMLENSLKPKNGFVCDECSSDLMRRSDDNQDSVLERLRIYYSHENDLLSFYKNKSMAITTIDGTKKPELIFEEFKQLVLPS